MPTPEERLARIETKLEHIEASLLRLEGLFDASEGYTVRLDRLETSNRFKNKVLWVLFTAVTGVVGSLCSKLLG